MFKASDCSKKTCQRLLNRQVLLAIGNWQGSEQELGTEGEKWEKPSEIQNCSKLHFLLNMVEKFKRGWCDGNGDGNNEALKIRGVLDDVDDNVDDALHCWMIVALAADSFLYPNVRYFPRPRRCLDKRMTTTAHCEILFHIHTCSLILYRVVFWLFRPKNDYGKASKKNDFFRK